jgi:hypothetical protein
VQNEDGAERVQRSSEGHLAGAQLINQLGLRVDRHDPHSLEIKLTTDLGGAHSSVTTDLYLFIPKTFEVQSIEPKELFGDFRSRMRLASRSSTEFSINNAQSSFAVVDQALQLGRQYTADPDCSKEMNAVVQNEVSERLRESCALVAECLKINQTQLSRQFFMSQALFSLDNQKQKGFSSLLTALDQVDSLVESFRQLLARSSGICPELSRLSDEYISQNYIQFLHTIETESAKMQPSETDDDLRRARHQQILDLLASWKTEEAQYRAQLGLLAPELESEVERESRIARLSQLKKFFQSTQFVDVNRMVPMKKFRESTALAATFTAGTVAAMVEQFRGPTGHHWTVGGVTIVIFGILLYVLRDRMKDWARDTFDRKVSRYLPDFERILIAGGHQIGQIKEWYRVLDPGLLPEEVRSARRQSNILALENRLAEDVIQYRQVLTVDDDAPTIDQRYQQLHENVRINIERHLKYMDDQFKEITELDSGGRFRLTNSHRVYHFNLVVATEARSGEFVSGRLTAVFRLVLDKTGLLRVERSYESLA